MVENAVEASRDLVDVAIGENVGFRYGHIAPMIGDVLRAPKRVGLGEAGRTAGEKSIGLVVAEARKNGVFAGKVVIHSDVELAFVELPDRDVGVVVSIGGVARIALGIECNDVLADRADQPRPEMLPCGMTLQSIPGV